MADAPLPTHAYIPGTNARHPEGAFDAVRDTADPALSISDLARSDAFCVGMRFIHEGYHWEAHELLEPVWMVLPTPSAERDYVQGLIQIANGFLKLKMDRPKAAARLEGIAKQLLAGSNMRLAPQWKEAEAHALLRALGQQIKGAI